MVATRFSTHFWGWLVLIGGLLLGGGSLCSAKAAEAEDWKKLRALDKSLQETKENAPAKAAEEYEKFFNANANLHPIVACTLTRNVAKIYLDDLKNPVKAIEVLDWAAQKYAKEPAVVIILESSAKTRIAEEKAKEVEPLFISSWEPLVKGAQSRHPYLMMFASRALQQYIAALKKENQNAKAVQVLQRVLVEVPPFIDGRNQGADGWLNGWMFEELVQQLSELKRDEEALSWAKLYFMTCAFNKDAIGHATKVLARHWGGQEKFSAIQAFARSQEDAEQENPLKDVKLPVLDAEILKAQWLRLRGASGKEFNRAKTPETISLLIASGSFAEAMILAQRLMKEAPEDTDSVQQVCRVFKAADLDVRRANTFLEYLDGKVPNPIPDFLKEQETKGRAATAPKSASTAASN